MYPQVIRSLHFIPITSSVYQESILNLEYSFEFRDGDDGEGIYFWSASDHELEEEETAEDTGDSLPIRAQFGVAVIH